MDRVGLYCCGALLFLGGAVTSGHSGIVYQGRHIQWSQHHAEAEKSFPDCLFSDRQSGISPHVTRHTQAQKIFQTGVAHEELSSTERETSVRQEEDLSSGMLAESSSSVLLLSSQYVASSQSQPAIASAHETHQKQLFVEGSFLYWFVQQEGNDYAVTGAAITVPGTQDPNTMEIAGPVQSGELHGLDFTMNPGFKVGGGIHMPKDEWELFAQYTHLTSNADGSTKNQNLNGGIIPLFSYSPNNSILSYATYDNSSTAQGLVSKAHSKWFLNFNNLNLEIRRTWHASTALSIRPFLGLQGSWQTQHFDTTYQVVSLSDFQDVLGKNHVVFKQKFLGIGLRLGAEGIWNCCPHLDLFGDFVTALLWGQFRCHGASYDTNRIEGYTDVLIDKQVNQFHALNPLLALELGLQSAWTFSERSRFLIKAGWENQFWFFQNQHSSSIPDSSLILQGLTLTLRLDF